MAKEEKKPVTPVLTPLGKSKQNVKLARTMSFPDAVKQMINGMKVRRESWGNPDYGYLDRQTGWLTIHRKDENYIWKVNDGDADGQDWVVVIEEPAN